MGRLIDLVGTRGCIEMGIRATATVASAIARRKRTHRVDLYNLFEEALENQRHKMSDRADVPLWQYSEDSHRQVFNTKRTWNLIRQVHPEVQWHSGIWFQHAIPKYAFCTWLATHNRLTTGDRMAAWNSGINPLCIFCNQAIETRDHIFFNCAFSAEVWSLLMKGLLRSSFTTEWGALLQLTMDTTLDMKSRLLLRTTLQASVHSVWRERNDRRHGATPMNPTLLVKMIDRQIRNWCLTVTATGHNKYEALLQCWFASRE
ncbi:PREDICTED: uncharacterized protein LOC106303104 [Brassica oleracea var. oleracea]|uniref:uncharacterized protein LOC106303104 n=1 Tax=Brassica oleracea var. oleracea TaxID=109376 RepID=UPI0006A6D99F|nr:PREDICTED: uncharacterized protein LOC106303104 [Brassica oleracea var. oleracea]